MKKQYSNKYIFELQKLLDLIDNISDEKLKISIRNQIIRFKDISENNDYCSDIIKKL